MIVNKHTGEARSVEAAASALPFPPAELVSTHPPTAFERFAPAGGLMVIGIIFLIVSAGLPFGTPADPGSGMWPTIVSVTLLFLGVAAALDRHPVEDDPEAQYESVPRLATGFAMLAGCIALFWIAGYVVGTVALVICMAKGLAGRSWVGSILIGIVSGLLIDLFFSGFLDLLSPSPFILFS